MASLEPHDAFQTDVNARQIGITPIVAAKKYSKAIAIKAPKKKEMEESANSSNSSKKKV